MDHSRMSNPFENRNVSPSAPEPAIASANPFAGRVIPTSHARAPSGVSTQSEEFSNPFEPTSRDARSTLVSAEADVEFAEVPLPGNAYESGAPSSTFGAYNVAASRTDVTEQGGASNGENSSFRTSASAMFKSAFGGGRSSSAAEPPPTGSSFGGSSTFGGGITAASLAAQQRDLERREQELLRRERDLEVRERNTRSSSGGGARNYNWPFKCWSIAYHNISEEIPPVHRSCVRLCYFVYVLFVIALLSNFLVVTFRLFIDQEFSAFLMAFIYMVCGVPGAYYLWYRRIYNSCKSERAFGFLWFFLMFLIHIAFTVFASLAPGGIFGSQRWALCGILNLKAAMERDKIMGMMHGVVMGMFMGDAFFSVLCIRWVYASFRSGGHSVEQARAEAYQEGMRAAAGRV